MPDSSRGERVRYHAHPATKALAAIGIGTTLFHAVRYGMGMFGPARPYRLQERSDATPESEDYLSRLACLTDSVIHRRTRIGVLRNGVEFYPAEFSAIERAQRTINLEAYEFMKGDVTHQLLEHLTRKACDGVQVRLLIDAIGSFRTPLSYFKSLTDVGGEVAFYHRLDLKDLPYFNHRTHRKLLIVDGATGFIGGADYADHWLERVKGKSPWRDTVLKVEGSAAASLNATFAQGWVDATGELLFSEGQFPPVDDCGDIACMVVLSTPGDATRARMLFQALIDSAASSIQIASPYFLPDRSARHSLRRAIKDRGVRVQVLTAGPPTDHNSIRYLSEANATGLLRAGVEFYEYEPAMLHAKVMVVDKLWSVAGSTNFDPRSLRLNNEVNIAIRDSGVASVLSSQFADDLKQSRRITVDGIQHQSPTGRVIGDISRLVESEE